MEPDHELHELVALAQEISNLCDGRPMRIIVGAMLMMVVQLCMRGALTLEDALRTYDRMAEAARNDMKYNWPLQHR